MDEDKCLLFKQPREDWDWKSIEYLRKEISYDYCKRGGNP